MTKNWYRQEELKEIPETSLLKEYIVFLVFAINIFIYVNVKVIELSSLDLK